MSDPLASLVLPSTSAEQTVAIGERLGRWLRPGDVVLLDGDLGAGKTTLTQGIALGAGVTEAVSSPTFNLVHEYGMSGSTGEAIPLRHLDLYRLTSDDIPSLGDDLVLFAPDAITVIEWPARAEEWLPPRWLQVQLDFDGDSGRVITMFPGGAQPEQGRWATVFSRWDG